MIWFVGVLMVGFLGSAYVVLREVRAVSQKARLYRIVRDAEGRAIGAITLETEIDE